MGRGGKRQNCGKKRSWNNQPSKAIRVPSKYAPSLLKLARIFDNDESLQSGIDAVKQVLEYEVQDFDSLHTCKDNQLSIDYEPKPMNRQVGIEGLYYITHFDNVESILNTGILCHTEVQNRNINYTPVYNTAVMSRRANKTLPNGNLLYDYANLYFQPRNAMLYSLVASLDIQTNNIAVIFVKPQILNLNNVFISMGNAASSVSEFLTISEAKSRFSELAKWIDNDWWKSDDGSKRKMMSECLVPKCVSPEYIQGIYVVSEAARNTLLKKIQLCHRMLPGDINISAEPKRFFQPNSRASIGKNLSLISGDLFFSRMQTLTISVNCVGVMGKGLASTAKYRFPDVYVQYQDLCKSKKILPGKPSLYTRESSVFDQLYDDDSATIKPLSDEQTWFLLFPTKNHWKQNSKVEEIENGLKWLVKNYKRLEITSLALPALGCGLGGLDWTTVGVLMCKYLIEMDIPVAIYLPTEMTLPENQITPDFLLKDVDF